MSKKACCEGKSNPCYKNMLLRSTNPTNYNCDVILSFFGHFSMRKTKNEIGSTHTQSLASTNNNKPTVKRREPEP